MTLKKTKNKKKIKIKIKNSLNIISPFYINCEESFYYELENFNDYKIFTSDINKF